MSNDDTALSLHVPDAGVVSHPEEDCEPETIRDLAFDLVRVLNDNNEAVGPWAMNLDDGFLLKGLRAMMKTRAFNDRLFMAQRQGKTSIYVPC